jgi:hypothetical protein
MLCTKCRYYTFIACIAFPGEIKIIFHPLGSLVGFHDRVFILWQENVTGPRNASLVVDVVFKWLRQRYLFNQEYHIPWGQHPRGIWYSWVNTFSYFLNPYSINVLLYRMKPRKHIYLKYCWQAILNIIWQIVHGTSSQIPLNIMISWRVLYIGQNNYHFRPLGAHVERTLSLHYIDRAWSILYINYILVREIWNLFN